MIVTFRGATPCGSICTVGPLTRLALVNCTSSSEWNATAFPHMRQFGFDGLEFHGPEPVQARALLIQALPLVIATSPSTVIVPLLGITTYARSRLEACDGNTMPYALRSRLPCPMPAPIVLTGNDPN